jgi:hypothetical protein
LFIEGLCCFHFFPFIILLPNGLELSCPAEAGRLSLIVAQAGGPGALPYPPARRVSFSELLGGEENRASDGYDQEREMLAPAIMILAVQGE